MMDIEIPFSTHSDLQVEAISETAISVSSTDIVEEESEPQIKVESD
jgi:hypothetical protein